MPLNYVSDGNGDTVAVLIPIEEWQGLVEKYPGIESLEGTYEVPQSQKDEVLRRKTYYEDRENELLTWSDAKKRLKI